MPDCQHLTITWDPHELNFPDRLETVHWLRCDWCPLSACVVTVDLKLTTN